MKSLLVASVGLTTLLSMSELAVSANCNKTPTHPSCSGGDPPPPPPDGSACVNSAGVFPALAYTRVIVTGKNRNQQKTTYLYLANSTGQCSIPVYSVPHGLIQDLEYVQRDDGEGRIFWDQETEAGADWRDTTYPTIRMVRFNVSNRAVTTPLPLAESTIYTLPISESSGIDDKVASHDGNRVYFSATEAGTGSVSWLSSLNFVDITNCTENCPFEEKVLTFPDEGVGGLGINDSDDRLFFTSHNRQTDVRRVAFIPLQEGVWSNPTNVVTNQDGAYQGLGFAWLDAGSWPSLADDPNVQPGEIISVLVEGPLSGEVGIEIFHTEACAADDNQSQSCFASQTSPMIRRFDGVLGPWLTSVPLGSALPPSLFGRATDHWVNVDLNSGAAESVLGALPIYDVNFPD